MNFNYKLKMNFKIVTSFTIILLILTSNINAMSIFSSKPGEVETNPSVQLMLRNFGLGLITDPLFNRIRKRWDFLRNSPLLFALLNDGTTKPVAQAAINKAVRMLREMNQN